MAVKTKHRCELLIPAAVGWERWVGPEAGPLELEQVFENEGTLTREGLRHVLALPASSAWTLPAWLKGESAYVRDMAQLHLERLGVRTAGAEHDMSVAIIASDDLAHLTCISALKDEPAPFDMSNKLPDEVVTSARCYQMPEDSIVIWRELGKWVVAITSGAHVVYLSPLSAARLDSGALAELNNICLQLRFQRVLGNIEQVVLWTEEGDVAQIGKTTSIKTVRAERPAPLLPPRGQSRLVPADIVAARVKQAGSARTRMLALGAGALVALAIAAIATLTVFASRERDQLLDRVAELTPRASKVEDHRKSWEEIASAVDPKRFPMGILLRCMEPESAQEIALTHFECAGDRVMLRGRSPSSSLALKYAQEIKNTESLGLFAWETPPPTMHSDDSATFELKGVRP
jgi:hypothetical protein